MMSPYLAELRKKVGHRLLLLPSVTILVMDAQKKVLLARQFNKNTWVAPGGMVEPNETPQQAAKREMKEETGLEVGLLDITGVYGGPDFRVQYESGDEVAYVMTAFAARVREGILKPDG